MPLNEAETRAKLIDPGAIVSLPGGVFTTARAGVKTNLLFFTKGKPTERIWYYKLSDIKGGKKTPLKADREELLEIIEQKGNEVREALARLKKN